MAEQLLHDSCKALRDLAADWSGRNDALHRLHTAMKRDAHLAGNLLHCAQFRQFIGLLNVQLAERRSIFLVNLCNVIALFAEQLKGEFEIYFETLIPGLFKLVVVTVAIIAQSGSSCFVNCINHLPIGVNTLTQLVRDGVHNAHPAIRGRASEFVLQYMEQHQRAASVFPDTHLPQLEEAIKKSASNSDEKARTAGRKMFIIYHNLHQSRAEAFYLASDVVLHKKLAGIVKIEKKEPFTDSTSIYTSAAPATPAAERPALKLGAPPIPAAATPAAAKPLVHATPSQKLPVVATVSTPVPPPANPVVTAKTPSVSNAAKFADKPSLQQAFQAARYNNKENVVIFPFTPATPVKATPVAAAPLAPEIIEPPKLILPSVDALLVLPPHPGSPSPVSAHKPLLESEPLRQAEIDVAPAEASVIQQSNIVETAIEAAGEVIAVAPASDTVCEAAYDGTVFGSPTCSLSVIRESPSFRLSSSLAPSQPREAGRALASVPPPPVFALELSSPGNYCAFASPSSRPDMALSVLLEITATDYETQVPLSPSSGIDLAHDTVHASIITQAAPSASEEASEPTVVEEKEEVSTAPQTPAKEMETTTIATTEPELPSIITLAKEIAHEAAIVEEQKEELVEKKEKSIEETPSKATRLAQFAAASPPATRVPSSPVEEPAQVEDKFEEPEVTAPTVVSASTASPITPASAPAEASSPVTSPLDALFPTNATAIVSSSFVPAVASGENTATITFTVPASLELAAAPCSPPSPLGDATFSTAFANANINNASVEQSASATVNAAHVGCQASSLSADESVARLAVSTLESTHYSPAVDHTSRISFALALSPIAASAPISSAAISNTSAIAAPVATPVTVAKKVAATFAPSPNAASPLPSASTAQSGTPCATPFKWIKKQQIASTSSIAPAATPLPGMTPWKPPSSSVARAPVPAFKSAPPLAASSTASAAAHPCTPVISLKKTAGRKVAAKSAARGKKTATAARPEPTAVTVSLMPTSWPAASAPEATPAPAAAPPTLVVDQQPRGGRRGAKPAVPVLKNKKAPAAARTAAPEPEVKPVSKRLAVEKVSKIAKAKEASPMVVEAPKVAKTSKKKAARCDLKELFLEASHVPVVVAPSLVAPPPAPAPDVTTSRKGAAKKKAAAAAISVIAPVVTQQSAPAPVKRTVLARIEKDANIKVVAAEIDGNKKPLAAKGKGKAKAKAIERTVVEEIVKPTPLPNVVVEISSKKPAKAKGKAKAILVDDKENTPVSQPAPKPTPLTKRLRHARP